MDKMKEMACLDNPKAQPFMLGGKQRNCRFNSSGSR